MTCDVYLDISFTFLFNPGHNLVTLLIVCADMLIIKENMLPVYQNYTKSSMHATLTRVVIHFVIIVFSQLINIFNNTYTYVQTY